MAQTIKDKLSAATVKALPAPATGSKVHYFAGDTIQSKAAPRGFGVRVTAGGVKAFVINYRIDGRERRYTIGAYPDWTVLAAVDEARALRERIDKGDDPLEKRVKARSAPTVADLCDRYIEDYLPRKRESSQVNDRAMIQAIIRPKLGNRKVENVRHADIDDLHRSLKAKPYTANRCLALASKMFSLAIKWDWRTDNPCKGIERNPESPRYVYLSQEEIAKVTDALMTYPNPIPVNVIRLLIFTGARSGEVMSATWDQFDLDRGIWTKPSAHTKQKKEHRVVLSAPALEILAGMRAKAARGAVYVFPGERAGTHIKNARSCWKSVSKKAKLKGVRINDLRHTYASIAASSGASLHMLGGLLGHTQPQTTARYAHLYDEPLREVTERVGAFIKSAGKDKAEVVKFPKGGSAA